jgi:hypothetical protein
VKRSAFIGQILGEMRAPGSAAASVPRRAVAARRRATPGR